MRITIFKNMKGLIHGSDPKRICCVSTGVLKIGRTKINVDSDEDCIMPMLFNGCTGNYHATFTDSEMRVFDLGKVEVRGGWIQPPPPTTVELMELRCRADAAEQKLEELSNIFDTDALNFLIK